jgi:hypothetical protein
MQKGLFSFVLVHGRQDLRHRDPSSAATEYASLSAELGRALMAKIEPDLFYSA